MTTPLRLGTRGSALALAQAGRIAGALDGSELVTVATADSAPAQDKSRFVRGIENALLAGEVDLAVHSAKDLPGELPEGLELVSVPAREDPRDCFCGPAGSLDDVPEGARIGTSSLRRRSQLLAVRPDLDIVDLHGNVDTRLGRLADGELDGIVLALAGLRRLGLEAQSSFPFDPALMTPAPGQGTLALEARIGDMAIAEATAPLTDALALTELLAERAAVAELEASCNTPIGIHAAAAPDRISVESYVGLPDGSEWLRDRLDGDLGDARALGREIAERMLAAGARDILDRAESQAADA